MSADTVKTFKASVAKWESISSGKKLENMSIPCKVTGMCVYSEELLQPELILSYRSLFYCFEISMLLLP